MLGGGPLAHIVSAFGYQSEHRVRTESMDLRQVGAQLTERTFRKAKKNCSRLTA